MAEKTEKTKNKTTDEIVLALLEKVKTKKAELKTLDRPTWLTNCSFSYNSEGASASERINIQTADINTLVHVYAFLMEKEKALVVAGEELGVNVTVKWQASPFKNWKEDIKTRISILNISSKKKELEELENRVNALVSPEQRRELELAELSKLI